MANEYNAISKGTYYCTLSLGKYSRPQPFLKEPWTVEHKLVLPLPSELRDDTPVQYAETPLTSVGDLINNVNLIDMGTAAGLRFAGNLIGGASSSLLGAVGGAATAAISKSSGMAKFAEANISGGVAALFPPDQITSAVQQAAGLAPNPNPSVAFTGPTLREFTLSWALTPKNHAEAQKIKKLVSILKKRALPDTSSSSNAAVLRFPYMCQLNFYPWDRKGDTQWGWNSKNSIIRIKKCVMAAVNVAYNDGNSPAFYYSEDNGKQAPIVTRITINFRELEYMLSSDWGDVAEAGTPSEKNIAEQRADTIKETAREMTKNPTTFFMGVGAFVAGAVYDAVT